jgi:hypothetical protein
VQRQPARSQRLWAPAWHSALTWLWHKLRRQDEAASLSCHSCFAAKNVVLFWRRLLTLLLQCSWFHVIHMHRPVMFVSICEHTPHTHPHTHTLRNFTRWTSHAAQVWQCFWGRGKLTSSQLSHHRYDNTAIIYVEKMYCYTGVNKSKCNIYIIVYIYIYIIHVCCVVAHKNVHVSWSYSCRLCWQIQRYPLYLHAHDRGKTCLERWPVAVIDSDSLFCKYV